MNHAGGYNCFFKGKMKATIECMNKLPFINEILKPLLDRMCLSKK
jgi:hypothetical protein